MAWIQIASSQRWTGSSPAIYFNLWYDKYRSGSSMYYKYRIEILPVSGASYFGYSIVLDFGLDWVNRETVTLKNNSPSQWGSNIVYDSGSWHEVSYKTSGTTNASFRLYSSGGRDTTYNYSLTVDPAGSVLGGISNFNIDSNPGVGAAFNVPCTKYYSGYYDVLTVKIGANTVATRNDYASGNVTFSNAELTTATTGIYARMSSTRSTTFTFELKTYTDSSKTNQIGVTSTGTATGTLMLAPPQLSSSYVTHLDSNATTVALTGSNTKFIQGYSNLQVTVSQKATAQNGATLGNNSYLFVAPGKTTQYANQSDSLNFVKTFTSVNTSTYNVNVTDSRSQQLSIQKSLTVVPYSAPVISSLSITRQNGSDADILLSFNGTYTNWTGLTTANSIQTARYRYREVGGSYGSYTSITLSTNTGGNFNRTSYNPVDLDISKSYEFEISITDRLTTTILTKIVPAGSSTIVLDRANKLIGINQLPDTDCLEGSIDVAGSYYIDGESIFSLIYPIGSIYMSINSTNPGDLFGGTWSAWGTGRVPVGIDTGQAEFNTVEKTGGDKNLQRHNHDVYTIYPFAFGGSRTAVANSNSSSTTGTAGDVVIEAGTGSGGNLQPYITCYMWKRTA